MNLGSRDWEPCWSGAEPHQGPAPRQPRGSWQGAGIHPGSHQHLPLWAAEQKEKARGEGNALRGPLLPVSQGTCHLAGLVSTQTFALLTCQAPGTAVPACHPGMAPPC